MTNIDQLDNFEIPSDLTDADAEYIRIKLSRCKTDREAEKYRKQLKLIENCLRIAHIKKVKHVKKTI